MPFPFRPPHRLAAAPARMPRQDALMRLLDTRIACLMVDRPATEVLRRDLLRLRKTLAHRPLDSAALKQVEQLLAELTTAPGVRPASVARRGLGQRAAPPWTASGLAGMSGAALLLASLPL
jgi:hypothetical protein